MRKIYIVPNIVTTANLFCGFYSMVASIRGEFLTAAWAIMVAGVFDLLDGRIARLAKAESEFGVEYDSLSDLISFGLAPAMLLYLWALEPFGRLGWLAAFLFLVCGALRLARFNVSATVTSKKFFMGMPIPIAAGMVATFVIFRFATSTPDWGFTQGVALFLSLGLGSLMISTIPFPSFKELNWRAKTSFGYLMIGVLVMVIVAVRPEVTLFLVGCLYLGATLAWNLYRYLRKDSLKKEKEVKSL